MKNDLVADIGGTSIRLALVEQGQTDLRDIKKFPCRDFSTIRAAIGHYLHGVNVTPERAALAIAGPISDDLIRMTNLGWHFSKEELRQELGLDRLFLLNDFAANALAIAILTDEQRVGVQAGVAAKGPVVVCGPGTGLGVAHLLYHEDEWLTLPGEGGHQSFAPQNEQEAVILSFLRQKYGHVSVERLLSGPGLENIHQALASLAGPPLSLRTAAQITDAAINGTCPLCHESLAVFCRIMGSFCGDLALNMATRGGVYIAGGIIPRFVDFFLKSDFQPSFLAKGRFHDYLTRIPVSIITEPFTALYGAALHLKQTTSPQRAP